MQTNFTLQQLADPSLREANDILRACVHCGFCTATCPTYVLLGDERDSPRGRIYMIKQMLEGGGPPAASVVTHVDRCLSCLACMTTCPSGVHYMHLVDHARVHIERTFRRPLIDRALRTLLAMVLPRPGPFRLALRAGRLARPLKAALPARLSAMLALLPARVYRRDPADRAHVYPAEGERRMRVALLPGCAQRALDPDINGATIRLLTRLGAEVVVAPGTRCCGALAHHLGKESRALGDVKANIAAWRRLMADGGLDAVVVNASGCGTMVKDYGFMLREAADIAGEAAAISDLALDVAEAVARLGLKDARAPVSLKVAYHSACSLQHGQKIATLPKSLLRDAGFTVVDVPEGHLCCGSAGTYNLLQPALAGRLRDRKVANIKSTGADVVAAGNIGCQTQLAGALPMPVVHTVELLDWATGGPRPAKLAATV